MALDERDYMRGRAKKEVESWKLSENEKQRRLNKTRSRFEAVTPEYEGVTLKQRLKTNIGSHEIPAWPIVLIVAAAAVGLYYYLRTVQPATPEKQQVINRTVPKVDTVEQVPATQTPKYDTAKESYWRKVYAAPAECKQARTALKELECRNQEAIAREQFERQWAAKLATGWKPREQR